jgi:drug/metabolite transporter (DMT)-like permease
MAKITNPAGIRRRSFGLMLVFLSAVMFSLAGVFTKAISADQWVILTWRGLIGSVLIFAYALWRREPQGFELGWRGIVLALVGSLSSITFISAFKMTYIANVTVIYAIVPFVAAGLEWLFLRERINPRTMKAALACTVGIGVLVVGAIGAPSLAGDAMAVLMLLLNALYVVLIRVFKSTPAVLAGALAAFQLFLFGWLVTDPLAASLADMQLLVLFGTSFAIASVLWTEGAKLVPAAEVGLIGAADVPVAILFGALLLGEVPPLTSLIGGAVVVATLAIYAWKSASAR